MTDFYSQNRCVCSTRSHGPLLCAFCLSFHFNASDVNLAYTAFLRTFAKLYDECCPFKTVKNSTTRHKPWITNSLRNACHKQKCIIQKNDPLKINYSGRKI